MDFYNTAICECHPYDDFIRAGGCTCQEERGVTYKHPALSGNDYYFLPENKRNEKEVCEWMELILAENRDSEGLFQLVLPKWELNPKADTVAFQRNEIRNKTWLECYNTFCIDFGKKKYLFHESLHSLIEREFKIFSWEILRLLPDCLSAGVSEDECVFIYSEFGEKSVTLDLFFEEDGKVDGLVSIIENKRPICSYNGNVKECIAKIQHILLSDKIS